MSARSRAIVAFALSGVAGLVYEVVWSRYLALFVGHSAHAQVLVMVVFLGGVALGSITVAGMAERLKAPIRVYAMAEAALAITGLAFHFGYQIVTHLSLEAIFPAIGSAALVGAVRWGIAGLMILPQSIVLGATFPLMAAALVRGDRNKPGRGVAIVYTVNTLGGALGVVLAGFVLIPWVGLPGALVGAALLNALAAALVWHLQGEAISEVPSDAAEGRSAPDELPSDGARVDGLDALTKLFLSVAFATALASFAYEIAWIRMLSLLIGSATHAFEIMLSAFILGLAGGAWLSRDIDASPHPIRYLGLVQVAMGLMALASLPVYASLFGVVATLVDQLPTVGGGYTIFNLSRYGIALIVMMPATILAGMTLPIVTGTLLSRGAHEGEIGRVYAFNTAGSVTGVALAGLILLPLLQLKGLLIAGAALDILIGIGVLLFAARRGEVSTSAASTAALAGVVCVALIGAIPLDHIEMTSGVYRGTNRPTSENSQSLFYRDGRTATVSAHVGVADGLVVLSTNGKPDASLGPRWFSEVRDTLPPLPLPQGRDYTTQVLAPIVGLAYHPEARSIANIGHGSGMTGAAFLTSETVERLVTIEIEPLMVTGSLSFLPSNRAVFDDPRSTFAFDDAKAFLSYRQERFDLIFAEPSNPWVSGAASLFTREFYARASHYLADGGVWVQWMQLYEIDDDLVLSVLAALDEVFPAYRAYLVGNSDLVFVASKQALPEADWTVLSSDAFRDLTHAVPAFEPEHLEALMLFDQDSFRPVLGQGIRANSDFRPILDVGAERTRFHSSIADGVRSFGTQRVDLLRNVNAVRQLPLPYRPVPAESLVPAVAWGRAAWMRQALEQGGAQAPAGFLSWSQSLLDLRNFLFALENDDIQGQWRIWTEIFMRIEHDMLWGTTGWIDPDFYDPVLAFLDREDPPAQATAAVDLMYGLSGWDWERAAAGADVLVSSVAGGERWVAPSVLLDVAVLAYLRTDRPDAARNALRVLAPMTGRSENDLRTRLLEALVEDATLQD